MAYYSWNTEQNFSLKSVRILTLFFFTGYVLTKGIYSIEQWQLTKGSKEEKQAEEGMSQGEMKDPLLPHQ